MRRILTVVIAWAAAHTAAAYLFRQQRTRYAGGRKHLLVVQGGAELRPTGDEISDAVVSVLMGGLVLDLRQAQLTRRPARLDVLSIMGGVELVVPEDWVVRTDVETTMAGVRDRRAARMDPERPLDLIVSGRVVMSGLEIISEMPGRWPRRAAAPATS
jgi:hypothetical protein